MLKNVLGPGALIGASLSLGYHLCFYLLRHHDEANSRPHFLDHCYATTAMGTLASVFVAKRPVHLFNGFFFSAMLLSPMSWWLASQG